MALEPPRALSANALVLAVALTSLSGTFAEASPSPTPRGESHRPDAPPATVSNPNAEPGPELPDEDEVAHEVRVTDPTKTPSLAERVMGGATVLGSARPTIDRHADVLAVHRGGAAHCTAVLIEPTIALTAAHCLPAERVTVGPVAARPRSGRRVVEAVRAPDRLDAALLRLDRPLDIPRQPRRQRGQKAAPDGEGLVIGFGASDSLGRRGAGIRRRGTVWFDGWGCDRVRRSRVGCRPGDELLIAGGGGADTCDGDSGGPVFERTTGGWRLVALTARPVRKARRRCGDGGIYVRVDRLAPWIDAVRDGWDAAHPSTASRTHTTDALEPTEDAQ